MIHTSISYSRCNDFTVQIGIFWVKNIQFPYLCTCGVFTFLWLLLILWWYHYSFPVLHCGIKTSGICGILSAPAWQAPAPSLSLRPTVTWYTQLQDHHHHHQAHHQDYHQDYHQNTTTLSLQPAGRLDICQDRRDQRDLQTCIFFVIFQNTMQILFDLCNFM